MKELGEFRRAKCSSCKAIVVWALTQNNRRMPLDLAPTASGNVVLTAATELDEWGNEIPVVRVLAMGDDRAGRVLYQSHFSTCPNADQHRSKR